LGAGVFIMSVGLAIWILAVRLFTDRAVPGWASTTLPIYALGGIQLLSLGVVGEYVAKVYMETKRRPRFLIEKITSAREVRAGVSPPARASAVQGTASS